jgi:hypothetical protein
VPGKAPVGTFVTDRSFAAGRTLVAAWMPTATVLPYRYNKGALKHISGIPVAIDGSVQSWDVKLGTYTQPCIFYGIHRTVSGTCNNIGLSGDSSDLLIRLNYEQYVLTSGSAGNSWYELKYVGDAFSDRAFLWPVDPSVWRNGIVYNGVLGYAGHWWGFGGSWSADSTITPTVATGSANTGLEFLFVFSKPPPLEEQYALRSDPYSFLLPA